MIIKSVILEWTFSPPDYFEEAFRIQESLYTVEFADGKITATIEPNAFSDDAVRESMHKIVESYFLGAQIFEGKNYQLSESTMHKLREDGTKDQFIHVASAHFSINAGTPDIRITDKDGNVIRDTRIERIDRRKELAALAAKFRPTDKVAESILASHLASIRDSGQELVRLYEIRDALATRFGGETKARGTLNISSTSWSRLGELANNEPLRQGRHVGRKYEDLRDATKDELREARDIAQQMIEAYLRFLESQSKP